MIANSRFSMHHNCNLTILAGFTIGITTLVCLTLDWAGFDPMTFKLEGQASNHYTTGQLMKMVVALLDCTLPLALATAFK